jgi:hypothetical protein
MVRVSNKLQPLREPFSESVIDVQTLVKILILAMTILVYGTHPTALAQVVVYEGIDLPESDAQWERIIACNPERFLEGGWLVQRVEVGECAPPPGGDYDAYMRWIPSFVGTESFFLEFRMITDGPVSEFNGQAPFALSAGSLGPVHYGLTISRDRVKLFRDAGLPVLFFDVEPSVPHIHRLEMLGVGSFEYFIDGASVEKGVPEGAYPSNSPLMVWQARAFEVNSTSWLDYLRFGRIPSPATGDFDSNGAADSFDELYFSECLDRSAAGEPAEPSCAWADFDSDNDVDCADWKAFKDAWTASDAPPVPPACAEPAPAVSVWGLMMMCLLTLTAGTLALRGYSR